MCALLCVIILLSGADSTRNGGTCFPPLLQMAWYGGTVSRRTANKKPPNCTDHHESTHQNDREPKSGDQKISGASRGMDRCPHFCAGPVPPLSTSFRRHCFCCGGCCK